MGFEHTILAFDPADAPAPAQYTSQFKTLAEVQGLLARLEAHRPGPNPKLHLLLTRLAKHHPGQVSASGGRLGQTISLGGTPPRLEGDGKDHALWALSMEQEDPEAFEEVMRDLRRWARESGVDVFDEAMGEFHPAKGKTLRVEEGDEGTAGAVPVAVAAPPQIKGDLKPCVIYLHRQSNFFGARVEHGNLTIQQASDVLVEDVSPAIAGTARRLRVIERLLQHFPWETCKDNVWLGCHPLDDPSVVSTARVLVVKVAAARAEEVLRVLMPLTRQLFVSVAVPSFGFFVEYGLSTETTNVHPRRLVAPFDSACLGRPSLEDSDSFFKEGLKAMLEPLGFVDFGKAVVALARFERPLSVGGGVQVLEFDKGGVVTASVRSERYRHLMAKFSENSNFALESASVVTLSLRALREQADPGWRGDGAGNMCWEEEMRWALEDVDRMLVPVLDRLNTAKDLCEWHFDPALAPFNPDSMSDWGKAVDRLKESPNAIGRAYLTFYAARYMPNEKLFPMLDEWDILLKSSMPPRYEGSVTRNLRWSKTFREMPQTPDGPM
jgi:hypothetical protein